jgi:DNA-binding transcriptional LysR family regulator
MNPTLRQLEAFVLVYRAKSITRAANELGLTQSAVSILVRQLEALFGVRLFDRTTRAVHPTPAATQAYLAAERILGDTTGLARQMRNIAESREGRVVLVASAGAASAVMPRILAEFRKTNPAIEIEMYDVAADQLLSSLLGSDAEFGIGSIEGATRGILIEPLLRGQLCAIGRKVGRFAAKRQLSWDELVDFPTIMMRRNTLIRLQIDEALARQGRSLSPTHEVSLINTALSMTAEGLGLSILPSHMLPAQQFPKLIAKPLMRPSISRQMSLIRRADRSLSPAAERFVSIARRLVGGG